VFSSVLKLPAHDDRVLFVARAVDPRATEFPPVAEAGIAYYQALEQKRFGIQVAFAMMFALIALIVLLSAIWFGLSFSNRLVAPIRRLIRAADQVATGNFYVQVPFRRQEGDLAHLGETFNKMTSELRRQHDGLTAASDLIDRRRRFMEAVLSGVSAGVIGIDAHGLITIVNPSAEALFEATRNELVGQPITSVFPEIAPLIDEAKLGRLRLIQQQIPISRAGRDRMLNIRVTSEQARAEDKGFIVTLDDITDLVTAQRSSAWADVARRIAHEIKNPLTPIQLSAERIRRHFTTAPPTTRELVDECSTNIIGAVESLKGLVDEFSQFARMPAPKATPSDLHALLDEALALYGGLPRLTVVREYDAAMPAIRVDPEQFKRVVINLVDNAVEALASVHDGTPASATGTIRVQTTWDDVHRLARLVVADDGPGLGHADRSKLFLPYYSTKGRDSGLGLAIVRRIIVEHGGTIEASDRAPRGAAFLMELPA
jgi:two-component system nitrogen regulation sensor histidine kinase NtrY